MAAPSSKVHVNRLLGTALSTWRLLSAGSRTSKETLRTELREALSLLEDAGDLIELSNGYWVPATTRLVELPEKSGYLLVGGIPSAFLPIAQDAVQYQGPHRHLDSLPSELGSILPVEALESWAKLPKLSLLLQEWAQGIIDSLDRQPYVPANSDSFEFYSPGAVGPGFPQFKRWSAFPGTTAGTLLARRTLIYGAREYRLVDVSSNQITSTCELHGIDARRLMYAYDLAAKNPVRAKSRCIDGKNEWLFTSELPRSEQRMFAALGSLTIPEDHPYQRRWTFVRSEELAIKRLRWLGIEF
jgi:hypothetical protein